MKKLSMNELNRVSTEDFKHQTKSPIAVVLDSVRSMNNVGSVFRTCDAFAVEKLYLCGITACPPHKDITKTALGATDSVDWCYEKEIVSLIPRLQKENYMVYMVEQTDTPIWLDSFEVPKEKKIALVFGNEVFGVDDRLIKLCDGAIEIPQFGTKHSLNVSVAAGIVIWDVFQKKCRI